MPRNLTVSLEGEIMILTVNAYGRPADKEKMPVPYHFFTARAMNHCCETSFFWVLSVMDYRPLISEAGLKAAPSLVSLLRAAYRGFLSFFISKGRKRQLSCPSCHFKQPHNIQPAPPVRLSVCMTALHARRSVTEGHNTKRLEFGLCKHLSEATDDLVTN